VFPGLNLFRISRKRNPKWAGGGAARGAPAPWSAGTVGMGRELLTRRRASGLTGGGRGLNRWPGSGHTPVFYPAEFYVGANAFAPPPCKLNLRVVQHLLNVNVHYTA